MEVIKPEAFQYGHDLVSISMTVAKRVMKIWPKTVKIGWLAAKVLIKAMPMVVDLVKTVNDLPYLFTDEDVDMALSKVLEELLGGDN